MERLILFDIDGTLVAGGPAKEAFRTAMQQTFGTTGAIEVHDFAGKTDPQIARELLVDAGLTDQEVDEGFPALWWRYLKELDRRLPERPMEVLAGVKSLLDALEQSADVGLGLLTGNIVEGARLKLGSAGLFHRFPVGGFGSDSEERNQLPAIAIRRARDHFGVPLPPERVVIVGDTPRDVACGRYGGCRTLAVATGRYGEEELRNVEPDHLFRDLSETERILEALVD